MLEYEISFNQIKNKDTMTKSVQRKTPDTSTIFRAWQGPRSSKKNFVEKLKILHTSKAHHRILRQILCYNTKFQINRIKNKDNTVQPGSIAFSPWDFWAI